MGPLRVSTLSVARGGPHRARAESQIDNINLGRCVNRNKISIIAFVKTV